MGKRILLISLFLSLFTIVSMDSFAQGERKYIRKGNKLFYKGDFGGSEVDYLRAIDKDSTSQIAIFNLGDALYKQGKYEEALEKFTKIASDSTKLSPYIVETAYNMGNTHFQTKKYQEAIDSYKMSLRMNPSDTTAKFNLAYAQLMLQKEQQQQQQQQQENKENKDNKENKENKDNKDNQDKKDQNKDQKKDQKDDKGDKKEQEQPEPKISKDQAEKMLQAIQGNEDKTQQKVKEKKGTGVAVGTRKNW